MKIFIYGTLKKNGKFHYFLEDSEFIGEYITKNKYPMIDSGLGFPYLINQPGTGIHIQGEIYEVNENIKKELDILEDTPDLFYLDELEGYKAYFCSEKLDLNDKEFLEKW